MSEKPITDNDEEGSDQIDWNWIPEETPLDPYGPLRGGLLQAARKLKINNGALLAKASILAITHIMVLSERLRYLHQLGHNAVPDRNRKQSVSSVIKKKMESGWPVLSKTDGKDTSLKK